MDLSEKPVEMLHEYYGFGERAVLIMDMQKFLLYGADQNELREVIERQKELIGFCSSTGIPILNVVDKFREGMEELYKPLPEIEEALSKARNVKRFEKKTWCAFRLGNFEHEVERQKYKHLFVSGAYAGRCIAETAGRSSAYRVNLTSSRDMLIHNLSDSREQTDIRLNDALFNYCPSYHDFVAALTC